MKLKRQSLVSQGTLARLLNTADEARKRHEFQQCVEILERASRLDPANVNLLLNLGHAHGNNYDYVAAERCFERAIRLAPKKTEALAGAALRARDFGNHPMAAHYYRLAAEQPDVSADALVALAEISERQRRLDEAAQLIERALRLKPGFPTALLVHARLERQADRLAEAEKILSTFPISAERDVRARAQYEFGGILDRQGRYDEAMTAFLAAKALLASDAASHVAGAQRVRKQLRDLRHQLKADTVQRWRDNDRELQLRKPSGLVLLCGHPRSGTTLLEQVLDSHPDIVSAEETDIFRDHAYPLLSRKAPPAADILSVLESAPVSRLQEARRNYFRCVESFLGQPIGSRLLIDKNPILTFLIVPFIRIFPETKFLVALRDPRDVVMSCFMQPLPLNQSAAAFLTLAGGAEDYAELMTMYQTLAPHLQNQCLEVRYEDMVNDLAAVARGTLDFLGVPWDARVLGFDKHAREKVVRSPTYADVTQPVYKRAVGRWRHYQKYLEPHLEKLEPFVKAFGYG
ncbi:MAG TPA: sulfotransferase [Verrucomicrobiae bacterium]|nr:sulfotransferase [Verrucomicrobiae bacterium]